MGSGRGPAAPVCPGVGATAGRHRVARSAPLTAPDRVRGGLSVDDDANPQAYDQIVRDAQSGVPGMQQVILVFAAGNSAERYQRDTSAPSRCSASTRSASAAAYDSRTC
jgi:hypothetical protein